MPKIQNVGRKIGEKMVARKIQFPKEFTEDGKPLVKEGATTPETLELLPGKHAVVTDEQFKHLKDNFGHEILDIDNIAELQTALEVTGAPVGKERPAGYLSPEEVDKIVKQKVEEAIAANTQEPEKKKSESNLTNEDASLSQRIDAMDRPDLIALIEKEQLEIVHKSVPIDKLKGMVWTALENKSAAKAA